MFKKVLLAITLLVVAGPTWAAGPTVANDWSGRDPTTAAIALANATNSLSEGRFAFFRFGANSPFVDDIAGASDVLRCGEGGCRVCLIPDLLDNSTTIIGTTITIHTKSPHTDVVDATNGDFIARVFSGASAMDGSACYDSDPHLKIWIEFAIDEANDTVDEALVFVVGLAPTSR